MGGVARWPWQEVWRVGEEAKVTQLLLEYVDSSGAFKLTHSPVALQLQGFDIERMFAQHVHSHSHSPSLPPPTLALLTHFISAATLAILRYLFSISKANSQLISIHHCLRLEHFSLIWISKSTFSEPEVSNVIKDGELSHTLRVLWAV